MKQQFIKVRDFLLKSGTPISLFVAMISLSLWLLQPNVEIGYEVVTYECLTETSKETFKTLEQAEKQKRLSDSKAVIEIKHIGDHYTEDPPTMEVTVIRKVILN